MTELRLLNLGCGKRRHPHWTNVDLVATSPEVLEVDLRQPLPFLDGQFDAVYASHVLEHLAPDAGRRLVREARRVLCPGGTLRLVVPDLEGICRAYLAALDATAAGEPLAADRHAWMTIELVDQMARTQTGGLMLQWWRRDPLPAEAFIVERLGSEASETIKRMRQRRIETGRLPLSAESWDERPEPSDAERLEFLRTGETHRWMYDRVSLGQLLARCQFGAISVRSASDSAIPNWSEYGLDAGPDGRPHKPDSLFMEAVRA